MHYLRQVAPSPNPRSEDHGPAGRLGIWFIGARGSLATTATIGLSALAAHLTDETGCVCAHPDLDARGLPAYADIVVGGHDVDTLPLVKQAERLVAGGVVPGILAHQVGAELEAAEARLRPGVRHGDTTDQRADVERLAADIREFAADVDRVVVVDVSSTEPPHDAGDRQLNIVLFVVCALRQAAGIAHTNVKMRRAQHLRQ